MAHLLVDLSIPTKYWDKKSGQTKEQWLATMAESTTLYIGNLSFYTSEEQLIALFSQVAPVSRVIMGLNRVSKTPCGFCFIEYRSHASAAKAVAALNGVLLDDRLIRVDWDAGFIEGRQYGRGQSGDQWRDDLRDDFDPARGGQGRALLRSLEDGSQIFVGNRAGGEFRGGRGGRGGGMKRPYQQQNTYMTDRTDEQGFKRSRFN